jgi:hypothetical protein
MGGEDPPFSFARQFFVTFFFDRSEILAQMHETRDRSRFEIANVANYEPFPRESAAAESGTKRYTEKCSPP